ncbi:DNA directed RNA polymerase [Naematelia encephala]|uniref:DNA directed RNA polymerase n=1 Tax=Naematelia encephala TaxID=71784 RepID=A0A1Y2AFZ6_9TREE|nr:DNA directed RNA polymerase [Naematelia encephala]
MSQQRYSQQNPNSMPNRDQPKAPEQIEYICGDCGAKTALKANEAIRCKECGHRVLYKPRTHRIVRIYPLEN